MGLLNNLQTSYLRMSARAGLAGEDSYVDLSGGGGGETETLVRASRGKDRPGNYEGGAGYSGGGGFGNEGIGGDGGSDGTKADMKSLDHWSIIFRYFLLPCKWFL